MQIYIFENTIKEVEFLYLSSITGSIILCCYYSVWFCAFKFPIDVQKSAV